MNTVLRQELQTDPLAVGYAGFLPDCPGVVADMLNAPTRSLLQSRFVTARTIAAELSLEDSAAVLGALKQLSASNVLIEAMWTFLLTDSGIDIGNANSQTMIDQLQQNSVFTEPQAIALKNLAMLPCSRAMELGVGLVTAVDVMEATQ